MKMSADVVGRWTVSLADGIHKIEFEHGTVSGKRVIRVDDKEIYRVDWMFKLVGSESFNIGKVKCSININATTGFAYEYSLLINGKVFEIFTENQRKILNTWIVTIAGNPLRVALEKDTLDVWVNGEKAETMAEFVENGTETHFEICNHSAYIKASSSGSRKSGIIYTLFVDEEEVPTTHPHGSGTS